MIIASICDSSAPSSARPEAKNPSMSQNMKLCFGCLLRNASSSNPSRRFDIGDINNDGYADIVVQNPTTGVIEYANMNNGVLSGWVGVASEPGFSVVGVGDINRDGNSDIVIQNHSTGQILCEHGRRHLQRLGQCGKHPGWNVTAVENVVENLVS
jgi:VCBS repeat protein